MTVNPKSLLNLKKGKDRLYSQRKKQRSITVTDESWSIVKPLIKEQYGLSISELVELIGRGEYVVTKKTKS